MYKNISIILISLLLTGCELTVDTDKSFSINIIDSAKEDVLIYMRPDGIYCKVGTNSPYSGIGISNEEQWVSSLFLTNNSNFTVKNGVLEGKFQSYNKENKIVAEGIFKDNKLDGILKTYIYEKYYFLTTPSNYIMTYDNGKKINQKIYNGDNIQFGDISFDEKGQYLNGWIVLESVGYTFIKRIYLNSKIISEESYDSNRLRE